MMTTIYQRVVFCIILLGSLNYVFSQDQLPSDGESTIFQDRLLDHLVGIWKLTGVVAGDSVENIFEAKWVLNHQFLQLHYKDVNVPSEYEALVYIGFNHQQNRYIVHWLDWVSYMVAHEYHHIAFKDVYEENTPKPFDLAYVILLEGRADSFARFVYPNRNAPWTAAITTGQELAVWQSLKTQLKNTSPQLFRKYLFGGYDGIPYWAGYTIGYHIIQKYLENNPEKSVIEWTKMDAYRLLQESSYHGYYKGN
jgi:uncharacterized protein YjaZ